MRSPSSAGGLAAVLTLIAIVVFGGLFGAVSGAANPSALGAEIGRIGLWVCIAVAIAVYAVQTVRIRRRRDRD